MLICVFEFRMVLWKRLVCVCVCSRIGLFAVERVGYEHFMFSVFFSFHFLFRWGATAAAPPAHMTTEEPSWPIYHSICFCFILLLLPVDSEEPEP